MEETMKSYIAYLGQQEISVKCMVENDKKMGGNAYEEMEKTCSGMPGGNTCRDNAAVCGRDRGHPRGG